MKTGYKVGDCMTNNPVYVTRDTTLAECAILMKSRKVGSLLVKEGEELQGILTERDIVRKAVSCNASPGSLKASDIMVKDVITIAPEKDILDAIHEMKDYDIRHLPVKERNKLVGFITIKDILKLQPHLFEILADKIRLREEERKILLCEK